MAKVSSNIGARSRFTANKPSSVMVNNRSISASTGGFKQSEGVSQRIEMRRMQGKLNTQAYEGNEMAKRRLQQKVATKASEVYGMDRSKLTKSWQGTGVSGLSSTVRTIDTGQRAQTLADKVNYNPNKK
jgi:hypothetical protein